ncbi:EamA family transporter [Saliphagus sp. GCM10025308]
MIDVYVLALLTALLWGFTPILDKRGMLGGGTPLQASIVVVIVDSSVYWIAIAALSGSRTPFDGVSLGIVGLFVVAGFVGTALGRLALFFGIDHLGASINNAVLSTRPLFATIVAVAFLGEAVSSSRPPASSSSSSASRSSRPHAAATSRGGPPGTSSFRWWAPPRSASRTSSVGTD